MYIAAQKTLRTLGLWNIIGLYFLYFGVGQLLLLGATSFYIVALALGDGPITVESILKQERFARINVWGPLYAAYVVGQLAIAAALYRRKRRFRFYLLLYLMFQVSADIVGALVLDLPVGNPVPLLVQYAFLFGFAVYSFRSSRYALVFQN